LTSTRFLRPLSNSPQKDLFPRAKDFGELSRAVKPTVSDCHDDLASRDLSFQMRVTVISTSSIVAVTTDKFVRSQLLQPILVIGVQTSFAIVDQQNTIAELQRGCLLCFTANCRYLNLGTCADRGKPYS
jgi:hypothetical protein